MSSTFAKAKARYEAAKEKARREAALTLIPVLGIDFHLGAWSGKAREALSDQWARPDNHGWVWGEIFRRHNDPDRLDIVIWGPEDRLCGLALGLINSEYVEIRFLEGDRREDCPLKGRRALITLECAACYAQERGRTELRIQPVNERLATLYRQIYGFELATPRRGRPEEGRPMAALLACFTNWWPLVSSQDKPLAVPELVCAPRPVVGFFAGLTPEQKQRALAYRGDENHGDAEFGRPSR